jgi:2-polyprenyl-3-methyl-5-hydroxy-6-metoxy-1,4-benzoquinol methylase
VSPARASPHSFNPAYIGSRPELISLVPVHCSNVLDLGCATGVLGKTLKDQRPGVRVTGVEIDAEMASVAAQWLDRVVIADLTNMEAALTELGAGEFDCLVFGDILEHLPDPWATLTAVLKILAPDGWVVASVPNVGHLDTIANLVLRGRWPYRNAGIHDRTHLRFFALQNVRTLFAGSDLEIVTLRRVYRLIERSHRINEIARFFALPGLRNLLTFQYLVLARRRPGPRSQRA